MAEEKRLLDEWIRGKHDEIGKYNIFKCNTRQKVCQLLKHALGWANMASTSKPGWTLIGKNRLEMECPCWPDTMESDFFWVLMNQEFGSIKSLADKYREHKKNMDSDGEEDLTIKQMGTELRESCKSDLFDFYVHVPDAWLMERLQKYIEIMWDESEIVSDKMRGADILKEIESKTGIGNRAFNAVLSGRIIEIKKLIVEYKKFEEERKIFEKEKEIIDRNDIKGKERLEKKEAAYDNKEKAIRKRWEKLRKYLNDFPQGSQKWFYELDSDDEELFEMLLENDYIVRRENWERMDRDKRQRLVHLINISLEKGNLSHIRQYCNMDLIELRIIYPNISSMGEIESWAERYHPEEIREGMQNLKKTEEQKTIIKLGEELLDEGNEISSKREELCRLLKDIKRLIRQYEEKAWEFWDLTEDEVGAEFELKIQEAIEEIERRQRDR